MSNKITVRIKNKKDIKFKDKMGFQYSKDGETLWNPEMDILCSEVVELKKLHCAPDRWGLTFQDTHWVVLRGEWFDILSKKEIKEHYDSIYDFVGELENTSYIHALILKEAGVL